MSGHYTDGRRWSYISKAWIFVDSWNDREEIARLEAKVRELEEQLRVATAINHAFKQSEENLEAKLHTQQDRVRELEERLATREKIYLRDQARIHDLEDKLRQVEEERDQARADTQSLRELVGQWIWAMYLTPESYECRTIETYRQAVEARVRQLEELVQAELPPPLRRLEQQELLRLRARVGELEALNHKLNKALVFAEHGRTLERLQDSETQRALEGKEGKEEYGTRRDE